MGSRFTQFKEKKYANTEHFYRDLAAAAERMSTPSSLGRKIKELRKQRGLTLEELASETGSSKSYIWELENKPVAKPSAEKVGRIASVFGVTPEFLLDESRMEATPGDRDSAFFRKYQAAPTDVKDKITRILDLLDE